MQLGYLGCAHTVTTSTNRRPDAFEHDYELEPIRTAFAARGHGVQEWDWRACDPARCGADLLFVRTVWDYTEHQKAFLAFLDAAQAHCRVANRPDLIRWNLSKEYLGELADRGLPVIDSLFIREPTPAREALTALGATEIVVKPTIGAGGFGQSRIKAGTAEADALLPAGVFAQPFMPSILSDGELSMIYLNGTYSHAVHKAAQPGEYRIQSLYGGIETAYTPSAEELALCERFLAAMPAPALAARIDLIRDGAELTLMELEVIEPYLYPVFDPAFGEKVLTAVLGYMEEME